MSMIELKMRQRITKKFEDAGAISQKTAVTSVAAGLDLQENYWLPYVTGTVIGSVKKTSDNLYYV